ncbi:helix-hairpin-helix domain-containing protein [Desulforhabdus sp. TSK]|uniref:ComEA family DNA-binding protein n=1 Tax=Desulforhabdus sp. TSK TaxID=2925014 RepID=UPI001FC88847|nr:helix-hairpin-helix domain-containing protein [Desulforhabdus sp. TSK]GKT09840.1 hypothetical protein DSTSK_31450 [Desulforhabdus sp. TSK]
MIAPLDRSLFRAIALVAAVCLAILFVRWSKTSRAPAPPSPMPVIVEILGDVQKPGVHFLEPTDLPTALTVRHAVEAAGGLTRNPSAGMPPGFDKQAVQSGQRIRVTHRDPVGLPEIELELMDAAARLTLGLKLNPNEASVEELCLIPQMKPEIASQIVARRAKKPWRELQDLQEITGVGPRTLEKWKEYLEVVPQR